MSTPVANYVYMNMHLKSCWIFSKIDHCSRIKYLTDVELDVVRSQLEASGMSSNGKVLWYY